MSLKGLQKTSSIALLALTIPLFTACGGQGQPTATTILPTVATAPTAQVAPTADAAPTAQVVPTADAAPTAEAPASGELESGFPMRFKHAQFGVVNHLYYTDRERVLTLDGIAGFTWVRQQVVWRDIEGPTAGNYAWGELDQIVPDVAKKGQKLLVSIVRSPAFYEASGGMPSDPKTMGNFVEAMAKRYGDQIAAYEIWNEPNLQQENGGTVVPDDAGKYVELLVECYKRIKAVSPAAFVIAAPPSSTGVNDPTKAVSDEVWYRTMYSYKDGLVKQYFDAQGVHPGGSANPPESMYPGEPYTVEGCPAELGSCWTNDATFYFRHVENVRRFMVEEGVGDHQIWITEYGWATKNSTAGYEFGSFVSEQQQSDYIIGAMKLINDKYVDKDGKPWVGAAFLWNMNYAVLWQQQNDPLHEQASFGILNGDYSPRLAFTAIQGYLSQIKQEREQQ